VENDFILTLIRDGFMRMAKSTRNGPTAQTTTVLCQGEMRKMLGQMYRPKGLALETAQAVLETKEAYAVNMADGCSNNCLYPCFNQVRFFSRGHKPSEVRLPKELPSRLVARQIEKMFPATIPVSLYNLDQIGVFLSFLTDPYLPIVAAQTRALIETLLSYQIRVAALSKMDVSNIAQVRDGMTIVSVDFDFWHMYEPNTISPIARIEKLIVAKNHGKFVWVSMEPYPPLEIYTQELEALLYRLKFVDLIVFGKWNYDPRGRTEQARAKYAEDVKTLREFGLKHGIRIHVKSATLKFIGKKPTGR